MSKMKFKIRIANFDDASDIAKVNIKSWKTTYSGIVDQSFLDDLDCEKRQPNIEKSLQNSKLQTFVVIEIESNQIIGFSMFGPCREKNIDADCELYAIYIYKEFQGFGAGKVLFESGFQMMNELNYKKMMVSVLSENQLGRIFYEKMGGEIAKPDHVDLGAKRYDTATYVWLFK